MPARTRANALADRVYRSPAPQQQVKFRPRKQHIAERRRKGTTKASRQQTLTQIDFVNRPEPDDPPTDSSNEAEEEEDNQARPKKRRRTRNEAPSRSAQFHTQTLTQLDFLSTPASVLEDLEEESIGFDLVPASPTWTGAVVPSVVMGPPKTPSRSRLYEVPSSQSPITPLSTRSMKSPNKRSPLDTIDVNNARGPVSPTPIKSSPGASQRWREDFTSHDDITAAETQAEDSHAGQDYTLADQDDLDENPYTRTKTEIKDEILDSDAEPDDDETQDVYDDEPSFPTQANVDLPRTPLTDTQEMKHQLHSTMLQYSQLPPPLVFGHEHSAAPPRPSQATTVDLSEFPHGESPLPASGRPGDEEEHATYASVAGMTMIQTSQDEDEDEDGDQASLVPESPARRPGVVEVAGSLSSQRSWPDADRDRNEEEEEEEEQNTAAARGVLKVPLLTLASSQILTASQMLPDSLMNDDSVPPPPLWVEDSDWEE